MFQYAQKFPLAFLDALSKSENEVQMFILKEMEAPIHDGINLQLVYIRIKKQKFSETTKKLVLNSLNVAELKSGLKFK